MPIENREIIFSGPELKSAITDFLHRKDGHEENEILKLVVTDSQAEPVSITVYHKSTDERITQPLSSAEVGAAAMGYCRTHQIMLSKTAKKSLISKDGKIILKLRVVSGHSAKSTKMSSLGT